MHTDRSKMSAQLVPLRSREAGEARVAGPVAERVALVARLSEMLWAHSGRPLPAYTRASMPVAVTSLGVRRDHD